MGILSPVSWKNVNKCNFPTKKDTISYFGPIYNFMRRYVTLLTIIIHTIYLHSQLCKDMLIVYNSVANAAKIIILYYKPAEKASAAKKY